MMRSGLARLLLACSAVLLAEGAASAASEGACTPPPGFKDTPHPEIAPVDKLVSHTEEVIVNQPLRVVLDQAEHRRLNQAIKKADSLPGVTGTYSLTEGDPGQPGARRIVCLTDGTIAEEEVLEKKRDTKRAEFRYVVWNYTTPKARPVLYGVGHFTHTDLGDGRTDVKWTYSFQLNRSRFPGYLGSFGDYLFRVTFLDREYAQMMRRTLGKE